MKALLVVAGLAAGVASGCTEEACQPESLAALEAQRHAEIAGACVGFVVPDTAGDPAGCPDLPEINAKYRKLREEWVSCQR